MFSIQRKGRTPVHLLVVVGAVAVAGCGAQTAGRGEPGEPGATGERAATGEPVVLRMANQYGELAAQLPGLAYFVNRVEELSGGGMVITVADSYGDFATDVEQRVIRHVSTGAMDLGWVGSRAFDKVGVNAFQALTAPMLLDSYALQDAVIDSGIVDEMLPALEAADVVGLGVLADGLRKPIGVAGPILGPADWEGIEFGTYGSDGQEAAIRALGATPRLVFGPRREAAILDDAIAGFEMGLFIYQAGPAPKWVALAPHVTTNVNLWPQMDVLIASPERLETLTAEQRGWLEDAADDAAGRSAALADTEADAIATACDFGARFHKASEADLAALRESFAPVLAELASDPQTKAFIEQIQELKASTAAEPEPAIPAGCTGQATEPRESAIVGAWEAAPFVRGD